MRTDTHPSRHGPPDRRLPRLRYAVRHPVDVLERSGVSLWLAAVILAFVAAVIGWLALTYFLYLS
ncbi:hypothetical protein [Streptomyces erythrochromogenes]|uniref:hypothetical protein n=1 Tax=Streptomyces erythrochromogenes TaxID=285574 RepID=UPI0038650F0C|nr:hypothetical protein OG489_00350 [Streptomyces erythrochromogenes]WSR88298.1 hypothetical protein OG489_39610 [Streptomyces erythrochromogenes]